MTQKDSSAQDDSNTGSTAPTSNSGSWPFAPQGYKGNIYKGSIVSTPHQYSFTTTTSSLNGGILVGHGSPLVPKCEVQYILVKTNGQCFELQFPASLTPREIIGFSQFFCAVSVYSQASTVNVDWTALSQDTCIEPHWKPGLSAYTLYNNNSDVQYVFLFDA
jgi:hypothetical protein